MLPQPFVAKLEKDPRRPSITYVVWPQSVEFFGTGGFVKINGTIDGYPFAATFMPMKHRQHMLPIRKSIRKAIGKEIGDSVQVLIKERI
jgi:hypothetical protein